LRRLLASACVLGFLLAIGSGCTQPANEPVTITVNYPSAQQFYQLYGYAFEDAYPHISVQVVQDDLADADSPPTTDVVYMNSRPLYKQRVEQGDLQLLTQHIRRDGYDEDTLSPVVLGLLRSATGGEWYGLTATFHSDALYYNKKLFAQYNVPIPRDQMSWAEVLELAQRFPRKNEAGADLYGLHMNFYKNVTLNYILDMGKTESLAYFDPKTLKVTMNTPRWLRIWDVAVQAFRSGSIYDQEEGTDAESMLNPPFYMEQAAMTKASHLTAYNFEPFSKYPNGRTIDWGMVTVPVDPANPTQSHSYSIYDIYGVSASSANQQAAWELIKFIVNDSENSRYLAQTKLNRGIPANLEYVKHIPGHDLSPLYRLSPATEPENPYLLVDASILDAFTDVAQQILNEAIAGAITVEQALIDVERKGQAAVDSAKMKLSEEHAQGQ